MITIRLLFAAGFMIETVAGSLKEPECEKLKERRLKRINFLKHDYIDG